MMSIYVLEGEIQNRGLLRVVAVCLMFIALFAGCAHTTKMVTEPIERGWISRSVLEGPPHQEFKVSYDTATVQAPFIPMLKSVDEGIKTIVVLGTWCPDSRRNVPHFLKVADESGMVRDNIKLYCVDRSKKSDDGLTAEYNIERVPTFIFFKGGKEIGRIVENPELTIEQDMVRIFAAAAAQP